MIKCFLALLFFILAGVTIWLVISMIEDSTRHGHAVKDYTNSICWNFELSSKKEKYLPSDVITLRGSCDSANDTKAFCPLWNITSVDADFRVLHDTKVQDGKGCNHVTEIQVVSFKTGRKRAHLLVHFNYPKTEPLMELNIEKSDDGEFCVQSRDCHFLDQSCSPSGSCTCPKQWIFIRNMQKCVPALFKIKEHCDFTAQCRIANTSCVNGSCECNKYYIPDLDSTKCIPEAIYKVKEHCQFMTQCKVPKSTCDNGICECNKFFIPNTDFTQCIPEAIYRVKEQCQFMTQCKVPKSTCDNGICECNKFFIPNFDFTQCIPEAIYTVKEPCQFMTQCKVPKSTCDNGICECNKFYTPNFDFTRCIPEGRDCGDTCLVDENCEIKNRNSVCNMNRCDCIQSYTPSSDSWNYPASDSWKDRSRNDAASSKAGFGWTIVFLVISMLYLA